MISAIRWSRRGLLAGTAILTAGGVAAAKEDRLAEGLVLRRVAVDEGRDVLRVGLPVHDQLRLADQLADARADAVDAEHRTVLAAHDLDIREEWIAESGEEGVFLCSRKS